MRAFENDQAVVDFGFFRGLSITLKHNGRRIKADSFVKHRFGGIRHHLRRAGHDPAAGGPIAKPFWEHIIDLMCSPSGGLLHRVEADTSVEDRAAQLLDDAGLS